MIYHIPQQSDVLLSIPKSGCIALNWWIANLTSQEFQLAPTDINAPVYRKESDHSSLSELQVNNTIKNRTVSEDLVIASCNGTYVSVVVLRYDPPAAASTVASYPGPVIIPTASVLPFVSPSSAAPGSCDCELPSPSSEQHTCINITDKLALPVINICDHASMINHIVY